MDELPAAIQNEIWQYVRGDRTFWKSRLNQVIPKVRHVNERTMKITRPLGHATIRLVMVKCSPKRFEVQECIEDVPLRTMGPVRLSKALKVFDAWVQSLKHLKMDTADYEFLTKDFDSSFVFGQRKL